MRFIQIAVLAVALFPITAARTVAQTPPPTEVAPANQPPKKIDYAILAQPAHAANVNLSDQQRAAIAEILDTRVNDLVTADPEDRNDIVDKSNRQIEALLSDEQKSALAQSLTGGKLQFSFHKQKWGAVLRWFAEQADLSLVMDEEPPGLFTYSDTREFTPAQAIDLLNSVLLSKNFTLIRRERMLTVVDTTDGIPFGLVQQVPLEKLSDYGRFEIVTTEFPLQGRPVEQVVEAVKPLIGNHGQVIPLAAADKILVTETTGRLKAINVVIDSVPLPKKPDPPKPPPKPPAAVLQTYPAPGLQPDATTEVLKLLFPTAQIRFDPNAEVIHCHAIPDVQAKLKTSLDRLIASVTGENRARLKTYNVPTKRLPALVEQIGLAHSDLAIASDPEKGRLLVVADADEHAEVANTLESFGTLADDETADDQRSVMLYPVDPASMDVAVSLLTESVPNAIVVPDINRIAIRGTSAEHAIASRTVAPFEQPSADTPTLDFYPLERPLSAEMLATLAQAIPAATISWMPEDKQLSVLATLKDQQRLRDTLELIQQSVTTQRDRSIVYYPVTAEQKSRLQLIGSNLPAELSTMSLTVDAAPGEIIAWGTDSQHQALEKLLSDLNKNPTQPVADAKKFEVTVAEPGNLLTQLQSRFPNTEIVFNEYTHSLYVWAEDEKLATIQSALEKISATMPPREELILIPYSLQNADASEVLALLTGMRPELKAAADTSGNRILVSATMEDHARYKGLIEQLDTKPNQPHQPQIQSYALNSIDPATAAAVLASLFPEMSLTSDAVNRRLVASGKAADHQRLIGAIEQIDVPAAERDARLESYDLGDADPGQVVSVVMQLAPTAIATASADGKQLFVWGDDAVQRKIAKAIPQLTTVDPKQSRTLKAYPLPEGAGSTALTYMQPVATDANLSLDATYENLIAWATSDEHQAIATALTELTRDLGEGNTKSTKVYPIHKSTPAVVYQILINLVPDAKMTTDVVESILVATATDLEHETIETVISQIEQETEATRTLKAYRLPRSIGGAALTMLQPVAANAKLSLDSNYEHVTAWATEAEHAALAAAIEELGQELSGVSNRTLKTYRLPDGAGQTAQQALEPVVPDARLSLDANYKNLIAWATQSEHQLLAAAVKELETGLKAGSDQSIRIYRFKHGSPSSAYRVLATLVPRATLAIDTDNQSLAATASDRDHGLIRSVIDQMESIPEDSQQTVAVYSLDSELITASSLVGSLDASLLDRVNVQSNQETNSLIVSGQRDALDQFAMTIETITRQLKQKEQRVTEIYRFDKARPRTARDALSSLMPDATFAYDNDNSILVATATAKQQETIANIAEQIDSDRFNGDQATRIYRLHRSSASSLYRALRDATPGAEIGYDNDANVLIVTASEEDHRAIQEAVTQIEGRSTDGKIKIYPLANVNATVAAETISAMTDGQASPIDIQANEDTNSLLVVADEAQHREIQQAIEQLDVDERTLEVFQLVVTDPFTVQSSIADLFGDLPESATPALSTDYESNKLFVRGTQRQINQVRGLLVQLGEPIRATGTGVSSGGRTRTIRFPGDPESAIEQLKVIWPRLRNNRIEIITPAERRIEPIIPSGETIQTDNDVQSDRDEVKPIDPLSYDQPSDDHAADTATRLVVFQNTIRAAPPDQDQADVDQPGNDNRSAKENESGNTQPPPVTIATDGENITISSDDTEALDRMESLLQAMAGSGAAGNSNSNFAIFLLRNTGATDVELLLKNLIEDLPFQRGGMSSAAIVADERLNALVVHGNRQAREMIGQLLEVLDTRELPDPLNVYRSEIINFQYARAERVLDIMENVYKTQLSAGGGRKPVKIPKGVTASVASVLQQINAAASGPVLTLDVDEPTNSLIMRAPPELREEIRQFAAKLDEQAEQYSDRRVRVIQIKQGKADQIRDALEQFMKSD